MIKMTKKSTTTLPLKHKGFTLAETLITLVIIGVVAALTVPNMIVKYQKEQTATRLKKAYSVLSQSTIKAIADNGPIKSWNIEDGQTDKFVEQYMLPYLRVLKNCKHDQTGDCEFKCAFLNNQSSHGWIDINYYRFILDDGTAIFAQVTARDMVGTNVATGAQVTKHIAYTQLYVDINGQKGPNVFGKDIFGFMYWMENTLGGEHSSAILPNTGAIIYRTGSYSRDYAKENFCNKNSDGIKCAALIMADNWQIKDDYPW